MTTSTACHLAKRLLFGCEDLKDAIHARQTEEAHNGFPDTANDEISFVAHGLE
jgi:hypothetical protein